MGGLAPVAFDPFLYVAFAVGYIAGRAVGRPIRYVAPATLGTLLVLLGLLGVSLRSVPGSAALTVVPLALVFAVLLVGLTAAAALTWVRRPAPEPSRERARPGLAPFRTSAALLLALATGIALGRVVALPRLPLIEWVLYVLVALVAFGVRLRLDSLRRSVLPLTTSVVGAVGAAAIMVVLVRLPIGVGFGSAFAFGWYSLAGPLTAARAGAYFGLVAFLANFFRESLTMLTAPWLGPRLGGPGLAAVGGATAMDTTLYFVVRFGDPESGGVGLTTGLVLTVVASLVVPLALAL